MTNGDPLPRIKIAGIVIIAAIIICVGACSIMVFDDQSRGGWDTNWKVSPGGYYYQDLNLLDDGSIICMSESDSRVHMIDAQGNEEWRYQKAYMISISVSDNGWTFFASDNGSLRGDITALDPYGNLAWEICEYGQFETPVIGEEFLAMEHHTLGWNGSYEIVALDLQGNWLWNLAIEGEDLVSPSFAENGTLMAFSTDGYINGISNGEIEWRLHVDEVGDSILALNDAIYYTANYIDQTGDRSHLGCLDLDGTVRWTFPSDEKPESHMYGPYLGKDDSILCLYSVASPHGDDGIFSIVEGEEMWSYQEDYLWGLRVSGDSVLAMTETGPIGLDGNGNLEWRIDVKGRDSPAISEGDVYFLVYDGALSMRKSLISSEIALAIFIPTIAILLTVLYLVTRKRSGQE